MMIRKYKNKESQQRLKERFNKVKALIESGYTMTTACNRLDIKFATFYTALTYKEKKELKNIYNSFDENKFSWEWLRSKGRKQNPRNFNR